MRYIFTAAACTLCAITALLALPPIGETDAVLTTVTAGDRAALGVDGGASTNPSPRQVGTPENDDVVATQSDTPDSLELALADEIDPSGDDSDAAEAGSSDLTADELAANVLGATENSEVETTTTTQAPDTTTTTEAPETTTTTEAPETTTTTAAPETTTTSTTEAPAAEVTSDDGVIISPRGVVLPVIGRHPDGGWRALTPCSNEVTITDGERVETVDFVLDPGHGGSEGGASGPSGATEKALNLRIAEIVEWYLEEAGYSVLLTRRTDIRIPLKSRAAIANALNPDAFVSIHHNGGATRPQPTPGTEMFVDAGNPESRRLGGILFEEVIDGLSGYSAKWVGTWRNGVSARLNSDGADLYGIHRYTPDIVSVITEAGYLSNASEEQLFTTNEVQWAHGKAIAVGLMRWKTTSDAGSGFLEDFTDDSSSGTGGYDGCEDPAL